MECPRYFLILQPSDIHKIFTDGWVDLLRGAEYNNLTVIDKNKRNHRYFWESLSKKRRRYRELQNH